MKRKIRCIAITGSTGMIGMAIVNKCIEEQIQIIVFTRRDSKRNEKIPLSQYVRVYYSDIAEYDTIDAERICCDMGIECDAFIHLAWYGTFGEGRNNVDMQVKNIEYTLSAVKLAKRLGCRIFIGAGSQAEYGRVEGVLNSKTPTFPENGYGIAKLCAGQMSRLLCNQLEMEHIWLRILSIYGPHDNDNTMIASAIRSFEKGENTSFTAGEQKWDYLYSEDAADMILKLLMKGRNGKIYCIGSGNYKKLKEYIHDIYFAVKGKNVSDRDIGIGLIPYSKEQVMFLCADDEELKKDVGAVELHTFEVGIRKTIEWYRNR